MVDYYAHTDYHNLPDHDNSLSGIIQLACLIIP